MTNGNWALKQFEHCSWRSKCFERGCFQTCPWVSHMKCQLYILFLGSKPEPSGLGPSCWWCLLPLRVASVFLSRFTSDYTSWTSCQWWTTWASWTDWAPQIGSIRNWPLRHCAKTTFSGSSVPSFRTRRQLICRVTSKSSDAPLATWKKTAGFAPMSFGFQWTIYRNYLNLMAQQWITMVSRVFFPAAKWPPRLFWTYPKDKARHTEVREWGNGDAVILHG